MCSFDGHRDVPQGDRHIHMTINATMIVNIDIYTIIIMNLKHIKHKCKHICWWYVQVSRAQGCPSRRQTTNTNAIIDIKIDANLNTNMITNTNVTKRNTNMRISC
jgi:hypothetical protein